MNVSLAFRIVVVALWTMPLTDGIPQATASASVSDISESSRIEVVIREKLPPHPRLLFGRGEEKNIVEKISLSPQLREIRDRVLSQADALLLMPPVTRVMEGRRLLGVSRTCQERILLLGMAWRMTGDDRYLQRAKKELLAVASFTDWNPSHFLDVAEMSAAVAVGYDWFFEGLSPEDRALLRAAIVEKGIKPSLRGDHFWMRVAHNWNQVCHGGLVLGAIAVAEDEPKLASEVIIRALECVPIALKSYGPDGAYPEGATYWSYGTTYTVMMIEALRSSLGSDFGLSKHTGFLPSADYMLHVTGPTLLFHNYSDSRQANGPMTAMWWFARERKDPTLLFNEQRRVVGKDSGSTPQDNRFIPLMLLWASSETISKASGTPPRKDWIGGGANPVAFLRSGWGKEDLFVGIKGGSPSVNHGHMDIGSFVMDWGGVRWAFDPGVQDYFGLEKKGLKLFEMSQESARWDVFRISNASHNMLMINDRPQKVSGRAAITIKGMEGETPSVDLDCSSVFAGQAQKVLRMLSLPRRNTVEITDAVEDTSEAGSVIWQMGTMAEASVSGQDVLLNQSGKTLKVSSLGLARGSWSIVDVSKPRRDFDAPNPGLKLLRYEVPVRSGESLKIGIRMELMP
jgi:hypothetical protein